MDNADFERALHSIQDPGEDGPLLCTLWEHARWEALFRVMVEAAPAAVIAGEDLFREAADQVFTEERRSCELLGAVTWPEWLLPEMREGVADVLIEQVSAQVNLTRNKRLAAVLTEGGASVRDGLQQELPGAVICEWGAPSSSHSALLTRVARRLEGTGLEQGRLMRAGKLLAGAFPDAVGRGDEDLAEFERQETLRQKLDQLGDWAQRTGFSETEALVYELDIETNYDTQTIAQTTGKSPSTGRQHRKRYHDKIRRVAQP